MTSEILELAVVALAAIMVVWLMLGSPGARVRTTIRWGCLPLMLAALLMAARGVLKAFAAQDGVTASLVNLGGVAVLALFLVKELRFGKSKEGTGPRTRKTRLAPPDQRPFE